MPKKTTIAKAVTPPLGRKRDPTRDIAILEAALDVLAEVGYDRMTIDLVALRAKAGKGTMYRRWASKEDLVIEAVTHTKSKEVSRENLPDTGSLRGDLLALHRPQSLEAAERKLNVMAGLFSMISKHKVLATAIENAISKPWIDVQKALIKRAIERQEFTENFDLHVVTQILPSMAIYRTLVLRKPFDKAILTKLIDEVLLPALKKNQQQRGVN